MKKALLKDFFMEVRKSKARFLSLFFIVALGVAFFSGIQAASPDMRFSGDDYYDEKKLMDLKVVGSLGLTEEDVEALLEIEGIEAAEGGWFEDVLCGDGESMKVVHLEALSSEFNIPTVMEGRLPEKSGECFLDDSFANGSHLKPGDRFLVKEDGDDGLLLKKEFTVVGIGQSPLYISFNRGNTTLGSGEINGFAYIMPEDFDQEVYTEIYLKVHGAEQVISYTDAYESLVERMQEKVEEIEKERCEYRLASVKKEAEEELLDGIKEYCDGEQEAMEALSDAERKLKDGEEEYRKGLQEFKNGERQFLDGKEQLEDGRKKLEDGKKELEDGEKELADAREKIQSGYETLNDSQSQLDAGKKELESAIKKLADGEKELEAGKKEWQDGKDAFEAGKAELETGRKELEAGKRAWQDGKNALEDGKSQLAAGEETLKEKQKELESGKAALEQGRIQLENGKQQLLDAKQQLQGNQEQLMTGLDSLGQAEIQLENGKQELYAAKETLTSEKNQLEAAREANLITEEMYQAQKSALLEAEAELSGKEAILLQSEQMLAAQKAELSGNLEMVNAGLLEIGAQEVMLEEQEKELLAAEMELAEGETQIQAGWQEIEQKKVEIEAGEEELASSWNILLSSEAEILAGEETMKASEKQLEEAEAVIKKSEAEIAAGKQEIAANKKKLEDAQSQIDSGRAELISGEKELADGEKKLLDGEKEIHENEELLLESEQTLRENEEKLEDAREELLDGWRALKEGRREYEEGKADAYRELSEAKEEIADGKKKIQEISLPEWFLTTRNDLPEYSDYGDNAERIRNLGKVFPVIFFLVAALISLTTMTRMVEDQRTQIGTLKALGYGMGDIASKYILYAFTATLGGSVLGILIGEKIIPWVIIRGYGIMYHNVSNHMSIDYEYKYALIASGAALLCTVGATLFSCYRELTETPASLMRPPAPKEGKRIFLEYLPFLWKRMNFTWKSSMRNLFRYKKRFFMTIFGIAGSMGLMLVGFGLHDSIMDIALIQYAQLQHYDGTIIHDEDADEHELAQLEEFLEESEKIEQYNHIMLSKMTAFNGHTNLSAYVFVPEDLEKFHNDVTLKNRMTGERYELTEEGAAICEKTASLLGISIGDELMIQRDNKKYFIPVSVITENYMGHYVYMTPSLYRSVFGENPDYSSTVFTVKEEYRDMTEEVGGEIVSCPAALSISYTASLAGQIDRMLTTLNMVVVVLIVSAGMLSFVVLYNLNNINITERQRELATLKVLGFYDGEVSSYVFRENIILTILGIAAGVFFGIFLHRYTITTVEVDAVMFGRNIQPLSFLYCAILTAGFSAVVNLFMHGKLKKINMVESLKSVE